MPVIESSHCGNHPAAARPRVRQAWWALRRARWFLALFFVALTASAEVIYDNSRDSLNVFISRPEEFGDEIMFAGSARTLTAFAIEVTAETNLPPEARVQIRLYRNNGPPLARPPVPTPGEILFQSPEIPIRPGVQPIRIEDLSIPLPESLTWTVQFFGTGTDAGQRAGLQVYHPPRIGRSFTDYWARDPEGFQLYVLSGTPVSFAARFEAGPDPEVRLTLSRTNGATRLGVTGPLGSEQIIQVSHDLRTWRTLDVVRLATTNAAALIDNSHLPGSNRYYRALVSPTPGFTVLVREVRPLEGGTALITLSGPPDTEHFIEASSDGRHWEILDLVRFGDTTLVYEDTDAGSHPVRMYRTRRPSVGGPILLIRSIERRQQAATVLKCIGSLGGEVLVRASSNLRDWSTVGILRFQNSTAAEFTDLLASEVGHRFYRLERR